MPSHFGPPSFEGSGNFGEVIGSPTIRPVATSTTNSAGCLSCATRMRRPSPIGSTPEASMTTFSLPEPSTSGAGRVAASRRKSSARATAGADATRPASTRGEAIRTGAESCWTSPVSSSGGIGAETCCTGPSADHRRSLTGYLRSKGNSVWSLSTSAVKAGSIGARVLRPARDPWRGSCRWPVIVTRWSPATTPSPSLWW